MRIYQWVRKERVILFQGVSQKFKPHLIFIKLGILQPSTPFLLLLTLPSQLPFPSLQTYFSNPSFLPFPGRENVLNNKGPTLAETHLPGQLSKSNDRKITYEMKQTLPLPVKCLYNSLSRNEVTTL